MAITLPTGGRWALSRIVFDATFSAWTTVAARDRVPGVGRMQNYLPPLEMYRLGGRYGLVWASDAAAFTPSPDVALLPALALDDTLSNSANTLSRALEDRMKAYDWTEPEQPRRTVPDLDLSGWNGSTRFGQALLVDVLRAYCRHDIFRPRAAPAGVHNTEYLDDFGSDPSTRWTVKAGAGMLWDSGNGEADADSGTAYLWNYTDNDPGDIEHECQVTFVVLGAAQGGAGVRMDSGASTDDGYEIGFWPSSDDLAIYRWNGGTRSWLASVGSVVHAVNDFVTTRNAAEGTAGNNVAIDGWTTVHGTSKPSDPGWIGDDATPDWEHTDSAADRLDASTHIECGISGYNPVSGDHRYDFWKSRAVSDRGGAASSLVVPRGRAMGALFAS